MFRFLCFKNKELVDTMKPEIVSIQNKTVVTLKKELLDGKNFDYVRLVNDSLVFTSEDDGYLFFPTDAACGVVRCDLKKRADAEYTSFVSAMPAAGICENERAFFLQVCGMEVDSRFFVQVKDNRYTLSPEIVLDGDLPYEDIVAVYHNMPYASYSDMARFYRDYQIAVKGCVPLKERARKNEFLKYAAESMELRVRMGWKPHPTPVMHQTLETEPPMKVVVDIAKLNRLVDEMYAAGVEKAEICLVGWGEGGHDGRFPQQVPVDKRYGTDDELKAFIQKAQKMGYQVVSHTNSVCAYEIADNWDLDAITRIKDEDGTVHPMIREGYARSGGLSGGVPFHLCARQAYEQYAVCDLPKVREYGFQGLHFVDELTICEPLKCYDKNHPATRKDSAEYYRKIARLSGSLFGGYQSEGWFDFINRDVDYIMYTYMRTLSDEVRKRVPLFDEQIPFWQLVYHGIVLSNPGSDTVNYTVKEKEKYLKILEYGGRPLMYIHSKFGEHKNWMGDADLECDTDEKLTASVNEIKKAYEDFQKLIPLQFEFMENHEKIKDGVYKTTYSNHTEVIVDYNTNSYSIYPAE